MRRIQYNAPVILTYTLIAFAIFLLSLLTNGRTNTFFILQPRFYLLNTLRMVTYVFGHADFGHFVGNFSIILLIGPIMEEKYGSKNLMLMMLTTALLTAIIHILFFNTALLGASGIVFMLILLTPFTNTATGKIPLTLILVAVIYIGREIFLGITVVDNVSRFAHIIGGVIGACLGFLVKRKKEKGGYR